ncbi:MAG: 4-hydroxy-3-methylbut-2-enyl diphosphate reductase [Candidatus Moranbacteria bacterium GW2011_GWE1_35_17]|nr:MAG: 4-hydroxy-3-methylbut-2-enyl diphosphate reductase [Candidatus Moranbacteria bacterium GW2011_GWE1_35_17]KKP81680.1 MAG: 4-hydroxy-3-methylbut-2-enyl diphosphate reductase [Candidatus Moranbacteria bacterium GW2011_GWF1_35_5]KKP81840.1 MAG: 4-hydroxy-3-methylbut-2-enyl diphosphate reductase [Candidatus Moranbacteria bacterium GW2011_GWF2_35_54]
MKVTLSKYAGFCDGVNRAYEKVREIALDPRVKKPIFVLGSLVHNNDVIKKIEKLGVKKIDFNGSISEVVDKLNGEIGTLVITAHGIGPKIFEIAKEKGINVVDTTCPKVIKAQRLAKIFFGRGYQLVIVGEEKHKEVQGIYRWADKKAQIISSVEDVENLDIKDNQKIAVVSQTTQNKDFVDRVTEKIIARYPEAEILDTVCLTTKNRQEEVAQLARENDLVFVVGSAESSNSNRLWEIAKNINNNTHFIERLADIKEEWLENIECVGITGGASSPQWVIKDVVKYLERLN